MYRLSYQIRSYRRLWCRFPRRRRRRREEVIRNGTLLDSYSYLLGGRDSGSLFRTLVAGVNLTVRAPLVGVLKLILKDGSSSDGLNIEVLVQHPYSVAPTVRETESVA